MTGFNVPARIGNAICLPGDIVFGTDAGVLFIPSHLVEPVVTGAAKSHVKDMFGFEMISSGQFTTAQIDRLIWSKDMLDRLMNFIKTDKRCAEYRELDWSHEYEQSEQAEADTQSAL